MIQTYHYEKFQLSEYSAELEYSYFELFKKHVGNFAEIEKDYWLTMVPLFFKPLVLLTMDTNTTQIFNDFLGYHILEHQLRVMIGRTGCIYMDCRRETDAKPVPSYANEYQCPLWRMRTPMIPGSSRLLLGSSQRI